MADADGGPGPSAAAGTTPAYRGARETASAHRQALAADKSPERLAAEAEAADAERAQQQQQQQEKQQQPTRQNGGVADAAGGDGSLSATDSDDDDNNQGRGWAARPLSSSSGDAASGEAAAAAATAVPTTGLFGEVREGELEQLMWQRQALSAELASLEVDVQVERVASRGVSGGRGPLRWGQGRQPGQPPPPPRADCALELEQGVQLIGVSSARPDGLLTVAAVHASSAPEGEEEGPGGGADGGGSPMRPRVARLGRGCGARGEEAGGLAGWRRRMEGAEARRQELLRRRGATGRHHTATAAARRQQREQLATRRPHSAPQRRNDAPRMQRCRLPSPLQTTPPPLPTPTKHAAATALEVLGASRALEPTAPHISAPLHLAPTPLPTVVTATVVALMSIGGARTGGGAHHCALRRAPRRGPSRRPARARRRRPARRAPRAAA
eukprot:COSAG01_NODE_6624_length_3572_cov_85.205874_1_plen_441_part_10